MFAGGVRVEFTHAVGDQAQITRRGAQARFGASIFALSTLGCASGNYLTGFYLIPTFTINALVMVCAGVLLVLAVSTFLMALRSAPIPLYRERKRGAGEPRP